DLPDRLPEPVFVLHESEAEITLAGLAEAAARADGDFRLFEQLQGEVDRAHALAPFLRVAGPDEHAGLGLFRLPADPLQALNEHVAALLVLDGLAVHQLLAKAHGHDAGDLDRLEDAVIVVALDGRQGADHLRVAGAEAQPPTGHVVALA